jgi:hypothetical protein
LPTIEVAVAEYASGDWPLTRGGPRAIVFAGQGNRDYLRCAVQVLSGEAPARVVYTHTGWPQIEGRWVYLHASGAIGTTGTENFAVDTPDTLERFVLPVPPMGSDRIVAVKAVLGLLNGLAPDRVMVPLLALTTRSALPGCAFSGHLAGRTGAGKTELAALAQQFFGAEMDAKHLPANWSSTANSLEGLAFAAKDALLVVDDFAPHGNQLDVSRFHKEADRLLRAQGNRSGRQRLRPDGTLRPAKPPRGTILSTGEDVPRGHSLRARLLVVEVEPGDVNFGQLSECQRDAASGLYAAAMSAYIAWLAPQFDEAAQRFRG